MDFINRVDEIRDNLLLSVRLAGNERIIILLSVVI